MRSHRILPSLLAGTAFASLSLAFTGPAFAEDFTLRIAHINDFHSRIEAISRSGSTCGEKDRAENKCFGGAARLKTAIADLRAQHPDLLVLDAGDQFQGSLFYTTYKGAVAVEMMNAIGFDAMAVGNHEFDDGPAVLKAFMDKASFPVISANTVATGDASFPNGFQPFAVVERQGRKIGIVSAVAEDTDVTSSPGPTIAFTRAEDAIAKAVAELEGQGVSMILLLSHLGIERDLFVAGSVAGIDAVIGGHSHVLLSNSIEGAYGPYPMPVAAAAGGQVPVVTAGSNGMYLGELTLTFDAGGKVTGWSGDTRVLDASVAEDPAILARIADLAGPIEAVKAEVVGEAAGVLNGDRQTCRLEECSMGNLVADAMLAATRAQGTTIAIQNGGGVRASIDAGPITMGEVLTVLPFQNAIATFELSGADIVAALENGASKIEETAGRFAQVAGLRYTWDGTKPAGARIVSVEVADGSGGWKPIDPGAMYKVASNDFMRKGGDGYGVFKDKAVNAYDFGPSLDVALAEHIRALGPVTPVVEGRITRLDK